MKQGTGGIGCQASNLLYYSSLVEDWGRWIGYFKDSKGR